MKSVSSLTFHPTHFSLFVSSIAIGCVAWLTYQAIRRYTASVGHSRSDSKLFYLLETLRVVLVVFAVLLFNQPEWTDQFQQTEKPTILILSDDSKSMTTEDVLLPGGTRQSRLSLMQQIVGKSFIDSLSDKYHIVEMNTSKQSISEISAVSKSSNNDLSATQGEQGASTDFATPIEKALREIENLRAVVLASDGDWNSGESPSVAASKLRVQNVPLYTVPIGSQERLPDIEIVSAEVPTFGIAGKSIRIPVSIESSLTRAISIPLVLETSDGYRQQKEIRLNAMGQTLETLSWTPKESGNFTITISLPVQPEEKVLENNQTAAAIAVRTEKLRVLVIESIPRWEYRYLRNALSRDPGVEVSCLLFHPGLSKVGGGNRDYLQSFPQTQEELSQFDVVFLGDVGIAPGQLTMEDCRWLKGLVEQQASGLVFLPGSSGRQYSLLETPLSELIPVVVDAKQTSGWGSRTASRMELTEQGKSSLLTRLTDSADENVSVWDNLPGFQWYASVVRAKAGSEILAVHRDATNAGGRIPLLVTQTRGAGKALYMATDSAWRWRKGVEDKFHYRFWGQVVRWMAYQRNMAKGKSMRMYFSPEQPKLRQTVFATANVQATTGEPLMNGHVHLQTVSPSGQTQTYEMASDGGEWGAYTSSFTPQESGTYQLKLLCDETKDSLETTILVQGGSIERIGKPARPDVLQDMARIAGGEVLQPENISSLPSLLQKLPTPPVQVRRLPIWSSPWTVASLIFLATTFWIGRKILGLL